MTNNKLIYKGAKAIQQAFYAYHVSFKDITRRAKTKFEERNWQAVQKDMVERLDLYTRVTTKVVSDISYILGDKLKHKAVWQQMKYCYSELIANRDDLELAETFFNSVTRRIFITVGVDPTIEYVASDFKMPLLQPESTVYRTYSGQQTIFSLIQTILQDYQFSVPYQNLALDAQLVATKIENYWANLPLPPIEAIDVLKSVFYRNKEAYVIGRIRAGEKNIPLILALLNPDEGIIVDAAILEEEAASIVFSFTRSYFFVDVQKPYELINFLKSILPLKPIAELYTSIGYNKHGKTMLYRDLLDHLDTAEDKFEIARGEKGMVMTVFTMPSFDVVFKIIKDNFDYPKKTNRDKVMERYQMVFKRDRAGRLVDAQSFEYLNFAKDRFSPELLTELLAVAANTVSVNGENVIIKHLYTERRLVPLNLYVREVPLAMGQKAVVDCGQSIKDLAATNIFPGDFLLKNFGVTRHGRVVFYDYDELCLITDCKFRKLPPPRDIYEEFEADPWFFVDENDIFPEEFQKFLGLPAHLKDTFAQAHKDLFGTTFWRDMQQRHKAGEVLDVFPYGDSQRIRRETEVKTTKRENV